MRVFWITAALAFVGCGDGTPSNMTDDAGTENDLSACTATSCPSGSYCDETAGTCLPGCNASSQCGSGGTCDLQAQACMCAAGSHDCAGTCAMDTSIASCGTRCALCPSDPHGTATCDGTSCGITCNASALKCGGACAACPSGATATTCAGTSCVATSCGAGALLCSGTCPSCPTTGVTQTTCSGSSCVATSCQSGYVLCGGACVACAAGQLFCCQETVDAAGDVGTESVLAIDSADAPHVLYRDAANKDLKYAEWGAVGESLGLALDGATPHASYWSRSATTVKYARRTGPGAWTIETVSSSAFAPTGTAIALDAALTPHVAYETLAGLQYASRGASVWTTETVDATYGSLVSLRLRGGVPHLTYGNHTALGGPQLYILRHAFKSGATWTTETASTEYDFGAGNSLALDGSVRPRVTYVKANFGIPRYATYSGTTWQFEDIDANAFVSSTKLTLDATDTPHAVVEEVSTGLLVRYYARGALSWSHQDVAAGMSPSIAVDSANHPCVTYYDPTMKRLRYAH